jgi:hypothetical protein
MSFIIDDKKKTVGGSVFVLGEDNTVQVGGSESTVEITGTIVYNFKRLTEPNTNHDLTESDYFVEVASNTYNTVTLPLASSAESRHYVISRAYNNTNDNLRLVARVGDDIDEATEIRLKNPREHITLISNGLNSWYIQ